MSLLPGGELTLWGGLAAAVLAGLAYLFNRVKQSGIDAQKAKEAKARDDEIARIKRASNASPSGSLSNDPNNRDNRPT